MSDREAEGIGGLDKMPVSHYRSLEALEDEYWWHRNRLRLARSWLRDAAGKRPSVLDLGCGTGGFLAQLARDLDSRDAVGVEASPFGLEACRRRGIDAIERDLAQPFDLHRAFDVVTAMDVLEHLPDEASALESARRNLRAGGLFLASVPALPWLFSTWDQSLGHHRRYTRRRLHALVEAAGFDVLRCSYAFAYALAPAVVRRLVGRDYTEETCVFPPVPSWLNALLRGVGAVETGWLRHARLPLGLSVYVLARSSGPPA